MDWTEDLKRRFSLSGDDPVVMIRQLRAAMMEMAAIVDKANLRRQAPDTPEWSLADDHELLDLHGRGMTEDDIAKELMKPMGRIRTRLIQLGARGVPRPIGEIRSSGVLRHGETWDDEEKSQLAGELRAGFGVPEIAQRHSRSEKSIELQIEKLPDS